MYRDGNSFLYPVIRLSAPLKKRFADERELDFVKLLDSSEYKEIFRKEMIVWGEEKRRGDPGFFCRAAIEDAVLGYHSSFLQSSASRLPPSSLSSSSPSSFSSLTPIFIDSESYPQVWIVSDARRQTDLQFFLDHYKDRLVRNGGWKEQIEVRLKGKVGRIRKEGTEGKERK